MEAPLERLRGYLNDLRRQQAEALADAKRDTLEVTQMEERHLADMAKYGPEAYWDAVERMHDAFDDLRDDLGEEQELWDERARLIAALESIVARLEAGEPWSDQMKEELAAALGS